MHFAQGSDDDTKTYGWCTLKEIMDFEEGYESLRDAIPYPTKTAKAESMNQWYKRAVQDFWDELHESADQSLAMHGPVQSGCSGTGAAARGPKRGRNGHGGQSKPRKRAAATKSKPKAKHAED